MNRKVVAATVNVLAVAGLLLLLTGVISFFLRPGMIVSSQTYAQMWRGVVDIRRITSYEEPLTVTSWHDFQGHPERFVPRQPRFPWFGVSSPYQIGLARDPDHRAVITPANCHSVYFPLWVPAMLLCIPFVWSRRNLLKGRTEATFAGAHTAGI